MATLSKLWGDGWGWAPGDEEALKQAKIASQRRIAESERRAADLLAKDGGTSPLRVAQLSLSRTAPPCPGETVPPITAPTSALLLLSAAAFCSALVLIHCLLSLLKQPTIFGLLCKPDVVHRERHAPARENLGGEAVFSSRV